METRIQLGPFELATPIGQGGMGEVWRAHHARQREPVAIKVMTRFDARKDAYRRAFRYEVEAAARMNHPAVVTIIDHGLVDSGAETNSGRRLKAGDPYLVMELVEGASLDKMGVPLPFSAVQRILTILLDGLAHAHARGLIHRDLKPANILIGDADINQGVVKLTDFGVAHALDRQTRTGSDQITESSIEAIMGSAGYMAPEQLSGLWRDYGPWTDLYGLGCVAFVLATGRAPFGEGSFIQLAYRHMQEPPPPVTSCVSLPPEFEPWVHCLLEKDPRRRFQRAADAALPLRKMAAPVSLAPLQLDTLDTLDESMPLPVTTMNLFTLVDETPTVLNDADAAVDSEQPVDTPQDDSEDSALPIAPPPPSIPATWRRPHQTRNRGHLSGAGLGLYAIRPVPLVNREPELTSIWTTLQEVHATQEARLVLLTGPAGTGKSRTAEWISQRADELGAATVLKAANFAMPGLSGGLTNMVLTHLRCVGLPPTQVRTRIEQHLQAQGICEEYEWNALSELVVQGEFDENVPGNRFRFNSASEPNVVLGRFLQREATFRPVILWVDDVHWSKRTLEFFRQLLASQDRWPIPVLVLATLREDLLVERPQEHELVQKLLASESVERLSIKALTPEHTSTLVQELLGLERSLARQVEARTAGNPMFAVQLIGDWVRRGILEETPAGFVVRAGENVVLPDDLHHVWSARIERLLDEVATSAEERDAAQLRAGTERALELAAVMGNEIFHTEWNVVRQLEGLASFPDPIELVIANRLGNRTELGWSFVHGMIRESLLRRAREHRRYRAHHHRCGEILENSQTVPLLGLDEKIGRHYVEGEAFEKAVPWLLRAAKQQMFHNEHRRAVELLDLADEALGKLPTADPDPRCGESWNVRTSTLLFAMQLELAERWAEHSATMGQQYNWPLVVARAHYHQGEIARHQGKTKKAEQYLTQAWREFSALGETFGLARTRAGLGFVFLRNGELTNAETYFQQAKVLFEGCSDSRGIAVCFRGLGAIAARRNESERFLSLTQESIERFKDVGYRFGISTCLTALGEHERQRGHLEEAESYYLRAEQLYISVGLPAVEPMINRGLILLERGAYADALSAFRTVETICLQQGRGGLAGMMHCLMLPAAAALRDWAAFDEHLNTANSTHQETGMTESDFAEAVSQAIELALAADDHVRAKNAFCLTEQLYLAMRDEQTVNALRERYPQL